MASNRLALNFVPNEMEPDVDVFRTTVVCALMLAQLYTRLIIRIHRHRTNLITAQVCLQTAQIHGLLTAFTRRIQFCLHGRRLHTLRQLTLPSNRATVHKNNVAGDQSPRRWISSVVRVNKRDQSIS